MNLEYADAARSPGAELRWESFLRADSAYRRARQIRWIAVVGSLVVSLLRFAWPAALGALSELAVSGPALVALLGGASLLSFSLEWSAATIRRERLQTFDLYMQGHQERHTLCLAEGNVSAGRDRVLRDPIDVIRSRLSTGDSGDHDGHDAHRRLSSPAGREIG